MRDRKPGWYPANDSEHMGQLRYWDGGQWLPSWKPKPMQFARANVFFKVMFWILGIGIGLSLLGLLVEQLGR